MINLKQLFSVIEPIYGRSRLDSWKLRQSAVHLALMQGDFLEAIIDGSKVIESRLTKARIAPVGRINPGDLVLFKQVGKQVMAVGIVDKAESGFLDPDARNFIKMHAEEIGIDGKYLSFKSDARYYALVWMKQVHRIACLAINKRDRRSWVVISDVLPIGPTHP